MNTTYINEFKHHILHFYTQTKKKLLHQQNIIFYIFHPDHVKNTKWMKVNMHFLKWKKP